MVNTINYQGTTLIVSNRGQIYTNDGKELVQSTITNKQTGHENKYIYVSYYDARMKRQRRVQVSRLVCMAFHPIDNPELYQVDHKDNNPQNNISSNLRWVSRKFNNSRKHTRMLKSQNYKKTSHRDEFLRAENIKTGEVKYFKNGMEAAKFIGCSHVLIYNVIAGKFANSAKGWKVSWISRNAEEVQDYANELALKKMQEQLLKDRAKEEARIAKKELKKKMKEQAKELKKKQRELEMNALLELDQKNKEKFNALTWDKHAVIQLTMDGRFVREYKSVSEAIRATGLYTIRNCVKGSQEIAGGFRWIYKLENN